MPPSIRVVCAAALYADHVPNTDAGEERETYQSNLQGVASNTDLSCPADTGRNATAIGYQF
jgi:hypothetical protein